MEFLYIAALFAVVFGGAWLWSKGTGALYSAANRTVQRKSHTKGQELLKEHLSLTTPPLPVGEVIDAIVRTLNAFDTAPLLGHKVYVTRVDPGTVRIDCGNRMFTAWTVAVLAGEIPGQGVQLTAEAIEATAVDGVVPGARELGLTFDRIRSAVLDLQHPTYQAEEGP